MTPNEYEHLKNLYLIYNKIIDYYEDHYIDINSVPLYHDTFLMYEEYYSNKFQGKKVKEIYDPSADIGFISHLEFSIDTISFHVKYHEKYNAWTYNPMTLEYLD